MIQEISFGLQEPWQSDNVKQAERCWFQAIEANPVISTWEYLTTLTFRRVVCHLHDFNKSIYSCRMLSYVIKILQNFWLTQVVWGLQISKSIHYIWFIYLPLLVSTKNCFMVVKTDFHLFERKKSWVLKRKLNLLLYFVGKS